MKVCNGYINSIYSGSAVDGKGLRCVIFFSGCNLRCKFCHNPETLYLVGQEYSVEEVVKKILRYKNYIKNGGVTLSGGEPFLQAEFCKLLIKSLNAENIPVAIETNGHIIDEELISLCEEIIVDIKNQEDFNKNVYEDFLTATDTLGVPVELTSVIIKGVNDGVKDIKNLNELKIKHKSVRGIRLLPFHKMCVEKYEKLNREFLCKDCLEPTKEEMDYLKGKLK